MHTFYYCIFGETSEINNRIKAIEHCAIKNGIKLHKEYHEGFITLQAETPSGEAAMRFKLSSEVSIYESH